MKRPITNGTTPGTMKTGSEPVKPGRRVFEFDATFKGYTGQPNEPRCHVLTIGPRGGRNTLLSYWTIEGLRRFALDCLDLADTAEAWYHENRPEEKS